MSRKKPFIKRYPRAVIRPNRHGAWLLHILSTPWEKPDSSNVHAKDHSRHRLHRTAAGMIDTHRNEPS